MSETENSTRLLLVPLEDIVVFPNMNVTLTVDVGDEDRVLLVPKHDDEYAKVRAENDWTFADSSPSALCMRGLPNQ